MICWRTLKLWRTYTTLKVDGSIMLNSKNGRHEPECIHVLGYERKPKLAQTRSSTTVHYKTCRNTFQYYYVLQSLHKVLPCASVYYNACTKYFPVLLCTTKFAQTRSNTTVHYKTCTNTFQYRMLQNLHKNVPVPPFTTNLHKHVPVLPYTTKLAETRCSTTVYHKTCTNTFPYSRILENLHEHVPILAYTTKLARQRSSTTVYYKTCANTFPVLAYTCRNTLLYYRILQNLHQHVPVLPLTTKLAETRSSTTKVAQARSSTTARYKTCRNTFQYYRIPQTLHNTRFCSFPYGHRINDAENDAKTTRKTTRKRCANQLEANKGPAPRPPDYNIREKYP